MLRIVVDTNVLISARRSRAGASNELLRRAISGDVLLIASVALFMEYEAVLMRPKHLLSTGLSRNSVGAFLDLLADHTLGVAVHYSWRPQLNDPADEMVLEAAINGQADYIVTFNSRHFLAAEQFGIAIADPATVLRSMR